MKCYFRTFLFKSFIRNCYFYVTFCTQIMRTKPVNSYVSPRKGGCLEYKSQRTKKQRSVFSIPVYRPFGANDLTWHIRTIYYLRYTCLCLSAYVNRYIDKTFMNTFCSHWFKRSFEEEYAWPTYFATRSSLLQLTLVVDLSPTCRLARHTLIWRSILSLNVPHMT